MDQQQMSIATLLPVAETGWPYIIEGSHTPFPPLHPGYGVDGDDAHSTVALIDNFTRTGAIRSTVSERGRERLTQRQHLVLRGLFPSHPRAPRLLHVQEEAGPPALERALNGQGEALGLPRTPVDQ